MGLMFAWGMAVGMPPDECRAAFTGPSVPLWSAQRLHIARRPESRFARRGSTKRHRPAGCIRMVPAASLEGWAEAASRVHRRRAAPHSGSHFARRTRDGRFFEGWYLRAVLPGRRAFAFMFSVEEEEDDSVTSSERTVTAQFLGPDETLRVHRFHNSATGWFALPDVLAFGHWERVANGLVGSPRVLTREGFARGVQSGFQMTTSTCCGRMTPDDGSGPVEWDIAVEPLLSWGTRGDESRCTATWLSYLPVFEPGYQILMGHGVATAGTVWANGRAWDMAGARVYSEKNWGQSFPKKWWWLQANLFEHEPDLTLTALGAQRYIAGFYEEEIGMIAVHLKGEMYEFSNWSSRQLSWSVAPWGSWEASARSRTGYAVSVFAETTDRGALVLGPSRSGMVYDVRDAAYGRLVLRLTDPRGRVILDGMVSHSAQVEVGGGPWDKMWTCSVKPLSHPLRGIINFGARKVKTSL